MNCSKRTAQLNDAFRQNPIDKTGWNRFVFTRGVMNLPNEVIACALACMMNFDKFDKSNDPYQEHDFGAFELQGHDFFWKFDYYAPTMDGGSEDPTDPVQTRRVLTLMLAEEY